MGGQVHVGAADGRRLFAAMLPILAPTFVLFYGAAWLMARSLVRHNMTWYLEERPATREELDRFASLPWHIARMNLVTWSLTTIGHMVWATRVADFSLPGLALPKTILLYAYGYLTASIVMYLLVEPTFRPYLSKMLDRSVATWPRPMGITGRLLLAWSAVAGAPLIVLALTWVGFTEEQMVLGGPALRVWSLVAAAVGLVVFLITGRSLTEPLDRLRGALRKVGDGDLSAHIEIDEGAEIGQVQAGFNEMVQQLRTQVDAIQESRTRIVEAADAERVRIERNLHDGAQQRLLALSFALRRVERGVAGTDAEVQLRAALEELDAAMAELRELARGIHPAILEEEGLGPALGSLAERAAVPTDVTASLNGRLPRPVEVTAYFVVAEALTNVARYADATRARVEATVTDDTLRVAVSDDGKGGADATRGSGLRGLADRVAALGGDLTIESPVSGGTRIEAVIPCG